MANKAYNILYVSLWLKTTVSRLYSHGCRLMADTFRIYRTSPTVALVKVEIFILDCGKSVSKHNWTPKSYVVKVPDGNNLHRCPTAHISMRDHQKLNHNIYDSDP